MTGDVLRRGRTLYETHDEPLLVAYGHDTPTACNMKPLPDRILLDDHVEVRQDEIGDLGLRMYRRYAMEEEAVVVREISHQDVVIGHPVEDFDGIGLPGKEHPVGHETYIRPPAAHGRIEENGIPAVHRGIDPQCRYILQTFQRSTSLTKFPTMSCPCSVRNDSGWN